jgi:hypothetical protein
MTSAPAPTAPAITDETLIARFRDYVHKGWTPWLAAEQAVRDLCREGHEQALIADVLPALLFKRWEQAEAPGASVASRDARGHQALERGHKRRVDLDALKRSGSLMESLFLVGDTWLRIGDMGAAACRRAAGEQKRTALEHARYARFFHAVAERVPAGSTVRAELFESELTRLFDEAAPR